MKPSLVLFTAITLLLPVGLASHGTAYDSINKTFSRSTRQGESQRGMGNGLSVLPGGWHDGEVVKRQARQGRVPAISRSTSEPTGDAIPHPQPNCVCDLRNTGGVAGFGSGHGWSASKASIRSLAHAILGCGLASAKGGDCGSGAAGAVIGEVVTVGKAKGVVSWFKGLFGGKVSGVDNLVKVTQGTVKNPKKGDIYAPGGRKKAKEIFRKLDTKGISNRKKISEGNRSRAVVGKLEDGTPLRIRFKKAGTTRIQAGKQKVIFPD